MLARDEGARDGELSNNFTPIRLMLAALVVVAHASVLIDGNTSREIFTRAFGTISGGGIAVDGFFLISGYLITKSFVTTRGAPAYLVKRTARVVPGYVACFAICVLVLAPAVGGQLSAETLGSELFRLTHLLCPGVPGVFEGLRLTNLDGSMWTIAYEARCYVATALLGLFGLERRATRFALLLATVTLLALNASGALRSISLDHPEIWGEPHKSARLFAAYGAGTLFYLHRDAIRLTGRRAALAAALLAPMLFSPMLAEAAVIVLGGYVLFWAALVARPRTTRLLPGGTDISYGLYLYAWPIQNLVIYCDRSIQPLALAAYGLVLASLAGYVSWVLVERPVLRWARARLAERPTMYASPEVLAEAA